MASTPPSALAMATMGIASALGSICMLLQSNVCDSLRACISSIVIITACSLGRMFLALLDRNGRLQFPSFPARATLGLWLLVRRALGALTCKGTHFFGNEG